MPTMVDGPKSNRRPPAAAESDPLGESPYRLLGKIGEGGMGEVFEAVHRELGHHVVIKLLRAEIAARLDMRDRMRVEGQALARIRHPHLVMVTDFGQTRWGRPYLVMERLQGRSLREELAARSVLPVAEAVEIARQTLLGLHAAHGAGLVHRDVKPDNVFLCATEDGRPFAKVLDFGVAKIVQAGRDPRTPEPLVLPTGEGMTLGTPRWFSPEQARGQRDLDARSDVYAVGLLLHAMVVGRGPFDDHRLLADLFRAHALETPIPPSKCATQALPAVFDRIVACALAKPREDRFADALTFASELGRLLASLGPEAQKLGVAMPVWGGGPVRRGVAEATTAPEVPAFLLEAATAAAARAGGDLRATARKLSHAPVIFDGLAERVRSNPPEHVKERLSRPGTSAPTSIDAIPAGAKPGAASRTNETAQMAAHLTPLAAARPSAASRANETAQMAPHLTPPASAPVPAPRSSVPETVAMFQLAPAPPARSSSGLAVPPGLALALPAQPPATKPAAWRMPAAMAFLALIMATIALVLLMR